MAPLTEKQWEYVNNEMKGKPKGYCECGHTGDGPNGQHAPTGLGTPGHGPCMVEGCPCKHFTWICWTKEMNKVFTAARLVE